MKLFIGTVFDTSADVHRLPPRFRPMNRYIDPFVSWDNRDRDTEAARLALPMQLPGCLKCPSDSSFELPLFGSRNPSPDPIGSGRAMWDYGGTSYTTSWSWVHYYRMAPPGDRPPYSGSVTRIVGLVQGSSLGREVLRRAHDRSASRFIPLLESRANYVLEGARPRNAQGTVAVTAKTTTGWHGRMNYHSALFLDGSARYQFMDTRFPTGPGWAVWPPSPWEGTWAQYNEFNE